MSDWLQKIIPPPSVPALKRNLPANTSPQAAKGLPPATIVYGAAAGAFFAFALYLMVEGAWVEGFLTMLPAGCFVGFAVYFLKLNGQQER